MVNSSFRPRRRYWLLPIFYFGVFWLVAWGGTRATATAGTDNNSNTVFMPYVGKPRPLQLSMTPFVVGFENKTITVIAHAGDNRLFVGNREGKMWVVNPDGTIIEPPFLDITNRVQHDVNFEQGFLGMAFHPNYPATPYFYIAYTTHSSIEISRGTVSPTNPNMADPQSLQTVMVIAKPQGAGGPSPVHNGGDLAFGPDGYLYIPLGDGGPDPYDPLGVPGDPYNNSQRRNTPLGSILRIDPDPARGLPPDCGFSGMYSVPPGNPWIGDFGCDEIWAIGLRNPWRISFDRLTGDLYISDVGEWKREEINFHRAGAPGGVNYGWHCWEGTVDYTTIHPSLAPNCPAGTQFTFPVHEYDHSGGECTVIGGYVYRGNQQPGLNGRYIFGDFCSGRVWAMIREGNEWQVNLMGRFPIPFSTFGEDVNGELYAGAYQSGILYKVAVR